MGNCANGAPAPAADGVDLTADRVARVARVACAEGVPDAPCAARTPRAAVQHRLSLQSERAHRRADEKRARSVRTFAVDGALCALRSTRAFFADAFRVESFQVLNLLEPLASCAAARAAALLHSARSTSGARS